MNRVANLVASRFRNPWSWLAAAGVFALHVHSQVAGFGTSPIFDAERCGAHKWAATRQMRG